MSTAPLQLTLLAVEPRVTPPAADARPLRQLRRVTETVSPLLFPRIDRRDLFDQPSTPVVRQVPPWAPEALPPDVVPPPIPAETRSMDEDPSDFPSMDLPAPEGDAVVTVLPDDVTAEPPPEPVDEMEFESGDVESSMVEPADDDEDTPPEWSDDGSGTTRAAWARQKQGWERGALAKAVAEAWGEALGRPARRRAGRWEITWESGSATIESQDRLVWVTSDPDTRSREVEAALSRVWRTLGCDELG